SSESKQEDYDPVSEINEDFFKVDDELEVADTPSEETLFSEQEQKESREIETVDDDVFHEQPMIDVSAQENEEEEETPPKQRGKRRSKKQRREENVDTDSDRLSEEESEE